MWHILGYAWICQGKHGKIWSESPGFQGHESLVPDLTQTQNPTVTLFAGIDGAKEGEREKMPTVGEEMAPKN